jgi:hypothetical protein
MSRTWTTKDAIAAGALAWIAIDALSAPGEDASFASLKGKLRAALSADPIDSLLATVLGGSYLFYLAEHGENPKVASYWDALTFVTTCLSVGYDDVFARTDEGKMIAAAVMTFGPALAASALDPPAAAAAHAERESLALQRSILARLDAILAAMPERPA